MRFEISTCLTLENERIDARPIADMLHKEFPSDDWMDQQNGGRHIALESVQVFFGDRFAWTNVEVRVNAPDWATAKKMQERIVEVSGHWWHSPSEPDRSSEWAMFSGEGDKEVGAMVAHLEGALRAGTLSPINLRAMVEKDCEKIAGYGHKEVFDTAVREQIWNKLDAVLEDLGVRLES